MSTQKELQELLEITKQQFNRSEIKMDAERTGKKWLYNVAATRIVPNSPLILGFNWGAKEGEQYAVSLEDRTFLDVLKAKDLGSISRVQPYLEKYFHMDASALSKVGQSNYCFFRSKYDSDIGMSDLELCRSLFERFLAIARPSMILSFSSRLRDYLLSENRVSDVMRQTTSKDNRAKRHYTACKGYLAVNGMKAPIYFLPHPNYQLSNLARDEAWRFCFGK